MAEWAATQAASRELASDCACVACRRDFDLGSLPAGASSPELPLRQNVPVGQYTSGVLALRVHSATLPSGARIRVNVYAVGPTREDPGVLFKGPLVAAFEIPAGEPTPSLYLSPLPARTGTHVSAYAHGVQGANGGTFKFALSLALRPVEGGEAWTPRGLGGALKCWLDERDQVVVSGAVADWGDQSDGGNGDFTQGTGSLRPASGQSINQLGAPDFDGTDDALVSNALSTFIQASRYHVFVVFRAQTVTANNPTSYLNNPVVADGGAGWWGIFLRNNAGTLQTLAFHWDVSTGERVAVASGLALNTPTLVEASFDGSTIRCRVGVEPEASVSAADVGSLAEAVKIGTGAIGAPYFDGAVAALLVCNSYLSATDRRDVRSYLSAKYGVPA